MEITLEILDSHGNVKQGKNDYEEFTRPMQMTNHDFVHLATQDLTFEVGDVIRVTLSSENQFLQVKLDETLNETLIFVKGKVWTYKPNLTENGLESSSDLAFQGKRHYLHVRKAKSFELSNYRNLALNPHDQKDESGAYPHATANVETRDDSTFFAKNAIDGLHANHSHGSYPYQSWGINQQKDAELVIDFGRRVKLNALSFTLRSDFPHDSYWTSVTVSFDDKLERTFETIKTDLPQWFDMDEVVCEKITLKQLIKHTDDSPFPALTEIEAYGVESIE